jgi:uncharacterized protein YprB with RNaseH-like and TPR domain
MDIRSKLGLYRESMDKSPQQAKKTGKRDIDALVPGRVCKNEYGCCYVIENRYSPDHIHGGCRIGDALDICSDVLAAVGGQDCTGLEAAGLLYLDTETTGLSGGTGTLAFLVGTGFFEDDSFVIRQYFIRDYDEETAMLAELTGLFSSSVGLVTFNGKAFDMNLLQSRFISNRLRPPFSDLPNIDLLYPARKVWGLKLESCRLSSLEENILGHERHDDIPGALIPSVYFEYLDDRDAAEIVRVIKHNEIDIMSMVSLLIRLKAMLQSPLSETDGGFELLGMGRIFETAGKTDSMVECLEACTGSERFDIRLRAVKRLTRIYKREGRYDRAMEHWKALESENPEFEMFHLIEMAKYFEHKQKDPEKALRVVEKALQICLRAGIPSDGRLEELKRRKERLKKKMYGSQVLPRDSDTLQKADP